MSFVKYNPVRVRMVDLLKRHKELSTSEIATALEVTSAAISIAGKRLEKEGVVARRRAPDLESIETTWTLWRLL